MNTHTSSSSSMLRMALLAVLLNYTVIVTGQTVFDSGSNGSYGPMNITADTTLDLPPDGIFHCTSINIASNKTLTFKRNGRNTPVYLLATGDVEILGTISCNLGTQAGAGRRGVAGPGGWDSGLPQQAGQPTRGAALGPGVVPNFQISMFSKGQNSYGNPLLIPLVGGSGFDDYGGGGAILVSSATRVNIRGAIVSDGLWGSTGGAIRIVAPILTGTGTLSANSYGRDAFGRIRIDVLNRTNWQPQTIWGAYSTGFNMIVFPPNLPKVEIMQVAGQVIDPNASSPVNQVLPQGTNPQQTVRCRVSNFNGTAKLQVRLTPENGDFINYNLDIPNPGPEPAEGEVTVTFPVNLMTRVDAWTREP